MQAVRNLVQGKQHVKMLDPSEPRNIVIVGGGIIGCSSAYFLTRHPSYDPTKHKITLLEASKIAGGASGKAGGLLALWAFPSSIVPLSYKLHASLAKEHDGAKRWGYRQVHCGQLSAVGRPVSKDKSSETSKDRNKESISLQKRDAEALGKLRAAGLPADLDWFSPSCVRGYEEMGDPSTTAQVHPFLFTTSMAALASEAGATILTGARVTDISSSSPSSSSSSPEDSQSTKAKAEAEAVESVTYTDAATGTAHTLPATDVIVAAGPWTQRVLPAAPISAMRAHSVTIRPSRPVSAFAVFTSIQLPPPQSSPKSQKQGRGEHVTPEIYARPDGECYACGEGDRLVPLPETTADVETDLDRCRDIVEQVGAVSDELRDGEVTVRQACYLPNVDGGGQGPLIGFVGGVGGLVLAAGHTCWGIQNGPGTGKLVSEFVFDGRAKSAKVGGLDPRKVML